jgi:hypothetical protein
MDKQQKEQEIVRKILLMVVKDNKDLFDKIPDDNLEKKEILKALAQSFSANGGVGYLRRLLKEIL